MSSLERCPLPGVSLIERFHCTLDTLIKLCPYRSVCILVAIKDDLPHGGYNAVGID